MVQQWSQQEGKGSWVAVVVGRQMLKADKDASQDAYRTLEATQQCRRARHRLPSWWFQAIKIHWLAAIAWGKGCRRGNPHICKKRDTVGRLLPMAPPLASQAVQQVT